MKGKNKLKYEKPFFQPLNNQSEPIYGTYKPTKKDSKNIARQSKKRRK